MIGSYREMKRITGVEISTLESWCVSAPLDQLRAFLLLLSAVPTAQRLELWRAGTFVLPRLDHEFIIGDRFVAATLARIGAKKTGLTLILADSEYLRSFMSIAFANTARANGAVIFGYDLRTPDWFIPVEGMIYLGNSSRTNLVAPEIPTARLREADVLIVNGFWDHLRDQQKEALLKATSTSHVILADRPNVFTPDDKIGADCDVIHLSRNPALPVGADDAQHMKVVIESGGSP